MENGKSKKSNDNNKSCFTVDEDAKIVHFKVEFDIAYPQFKSRFEPLMKYENRDPTELVRDLFIGSLESRKVTLKLSDLVELWKLGESTEFWVKVLKRGRRG